MDGRYKIRVLVGGVDGHSFKRVYSTSEELEGWTLLVDWTLRNSVSNSCQNLEILPVSGWPRSRLSKLLKIVRQRKVLECYIENINALMFEQSPVHGSIVLDPKISSVLIQFRVVWQRPGWPEVYLTIRIRSRRPKVTRWERSISFFVQKWRFRVGNLDGKTGLLTGLLGGKQVWKCLVALVDLLWVQITQSYPNRLRFSRLPCPQSPCHTVIDPVFKEGFFWR
jgi:hypothetical protein